MGKSFTFSIAGFYFGLFVCHAFREIEICRGETSIWRRRF